MFIDGPVRPFKCEICGGDFNRSDILAKHRKIHQKSTTEIETVQRCHESSKGQVNDCVLAQEKKSLITPRHTNSDTDIDPELIFSKQFLDQDEFRGIVTGLFQDNDLSWLFEPCTKEKRSQSSDRLEQLGKNEIFAPITVDFFHSVLDTPEAITFSESMSISNLLIPDSQSLRKEPDKWLSISKTLQEVLLSTIVDLPYIDKEDYFAPETLKRNFELYFCTFHDHFPILHRVSFISNPWNIPPLLLISIIILGTVKGSEKSYSASVKIHEKLMWTVFSHPDLIPSKLWIIQTLALTQAFAKMASTRHQHEISATFHSAIITILKRDGSCTNIGSLKIQSEQSSEVQQKWELWIEQESIKRVVYFFFIMDSQHSVLFGHPSSMSVTEIMLELPCSDNIWDLDSAISWESHYNLKTTEKPRLFLELLKSLMDDQSLPVIISSYSKLIMLHGLLAVIWSVVRGEPRSFEIENQESPHRAFIEARKKAILARAVETWSYSLLNRMPSKAIEACSTLHGITYLTLFTSKSSILEILTFCGSPSLMGRPMTKNDKVKAFASVERWAGSFEAIQCVVHALLLIQRITFFSDRSSNSTYSNDMYRAAKDDIVFRPWCLYISTLVVWSYSFFANEKKLSLKEPVVVQHNIVAEQFMIDMLRALQKRIKLNDMTDSQLVPLPDLDNCCSMVIVVRNSLVNCRWEMLNDAYNFLGELITTWDISKRGSML